MRALLLLGLSLSLLFGSACSDKEGILLNVSTKMESPIDRLEFVIGEDTGNEYFSERSLGAMEPLHGRDLRLEPFKLFLRANSEDQLIGDLQSNMIVVAVRALAANGDVIGFGYSDVLRFSPGEIREWSIEIVDVERSPTEVEGCLKWEGADGKVELAPFDDQDCDGEIARENGGNDCNDLDPSIGTFANEICGNGTDDNCNDMTDFDEDADTDGFFACSVNPEEEDCDDTEASVFPMFVSVCQGGFYLCEEESVPFDAEGDICYGYNTDIARCFEGVLACADDASDSPFLCNSLTRMVRPGFCLPEECDPNEPEVCAPTEHIECDLTFTSPGKNGGQVCNLDGPLLDRASATLPPGPPTCKEAKIADEFAIPGWKLKVKNGPNNCIGDVIEAQRTDSNMNGLLQPVLIQQFDNNDTVLYQYVINVNPIQVETCAEVDGLVCGSNSSEGEWGTPIPPPSMD